MTMTGKQRRHLRAIAHSTKPLLNLGKLGLSQEIKSEIKSQLFDHELIKLRILDTCPLSKKECAQELSIDNEIEVIQVIGKTLLLYSQNPEEPKIKFPTS